MIIKQINITGLLITILFFSCKNSNTKIEGTWTYIKAIENGKEIKRSEPESKYQMEFKNGETKLLLDNKGTGPGLLYYKFEGDSLFLTNIQIDSLGRNDTLNAIGAFVMIKNDTLTAVTGSTTAYYVREKN
jgi:hypothetical protein